MEYSTTNATNIVTEKNIIIYICAHLVMPCAVAIGIIGNLLSILVFARREMIKYCVSIFTIVLALSDMLLLTISLFNLILPELFSSLSDESAFWCHFHGYFDLLFAAVSGYSVVFISVERWFSVWKPFDKAKYVTFKTTIIAVMSYVSISSVLFLWFPLTLSFNPTEPVPEKRCGLQHPTVYKIFGTISVIYTYITPFIFLGILNILIVYRLHTRQQKSIHHSTKSPSIGGRSEPTTTQKRHQKQRHTDRNITFMLITVAIAFMVMSFPYQILWFYMQISQPSEPNKPLIILTQTFRYLNCCCNVFLYSATSSLFRRQLQEIFQCIKSSKTKKTMTDINVNHRTKVSLTPITGSHSKDNVSSERRNLLSTRTTVEKLNLIDPTNGHMISS